MSNLQGRADSLKKEQIRLKQIINEKNTANILLGLFSSAGGEKSSRDEDPRVEELLRRPIDDIPDTTKIPELPALILPGQHASKKLRESPTIALNGNSEVPDDGIDYELLGKDRAKCTPEELDRIRRERNRMHAKRTRDRKRLFMEEMAEICRKLEEENELLRKNLAIIDPDHPAVVPQLDDSAVEKTCCNVKDVVCTNDAPTNARSKAAGALADQIKNFKTLLDAAAYSDPQLVSSDDNKSDADNHSDDLGKNHSPIAKRRRVTTIGSEGRTVLGC